MTNKELWKLYNLLRKFAYACIDEKDIKSQTGADYISDEELRDFTIKAGQLLLKMSRYMPNAWKRGIGYEDEEEL